MRSYGYCRRCGGTFRKARDFLAEPDLFALGIGWGTVLCDQCFRVRVSATYAQIREV